MNKKKNGNLETNKSKGITLIALVVTIIVLLILAGVTVNLLIGNKGLLSRARNAVDTYENASKNEQSDLENVEDMLNDYFYNGKTFIVTFDANGGSVSIENKEVTYGSEYGSLPIPTRVGFDFLRLVYRRWPTSN